MDENDRIRQEMDATINELKAQGIDQNTHVGSNYVGLGDVVESVLTKMGITQERVKEWFNLQECRCSERKAWLNGLFKWKVGE